MQKSYAAGSVFLWTFVTGSFSAKLPVVRMERLFFYALHKVIF